MPSPERDVRALRDPDLKIAPGMLEAFDAACDLAGRYPAMITARVVDADTLLERRPRKHKPPRNLVEFFVDTTGILVVATGRERDRPLHWAEVPLPASGSAVADRALRAALWRHAKCGMHAIGREITPGQPGAAGT